LKAVRDIGRSNEAAIGTLVPMLWEEYYVRLGVVIDGNCRITCNGVDDALKDGSLAVSLRASVEGMGLNFPNQRRASAPLLR
jgi:hypothetical protein